MLNHRSSQIAALVATLSLLTIGTGCEFFAAMLGVSSTDSSTNATTGASTDPNDHGNTSDTNPIATNPGGGIVADHNATSAFDSIPDSVITTIKSGYRIFYGHTSHGSQIVTGAEMLAAEDGRYAVNSGSGSLQIQEDGGSDLGYNGDLDWIYITRDALDADDDINVVIWSWCGGVSDNTSSGIDTYLNAMAGLESEYPAVTFVYMTGHLDGTGPNGNLYARNNQIRAYCRDNNKVLFDFADIESYAPDGTYYGWGSDWCEWCETWCETHACESCDDCAHSVCFNCYRKGQVFWWMMARIAGWDG